MNEQRELISQADFAKRMGVSRAAVSQWKRNDILTDAAFSQPGKKGKLYYDQACEDVRRNRDIGQSLGNGIKTGTDAPPQPAAKEVPPDPPAVPAPSPPTPAPTPAPEPTFPKEPTVEDLLKDARLEALQRTNRMEAAKEAELSGSLMDAIEARSQMTQIAGLMMQVFEGSLVDIAGVIAAKFKLQKRDVLHELKTAFRDVRQTAAAKNRKQLKDIDAVSEVHLGDE